MDEQKKITYGGLPPETIAKWVVAEEGRLSLLSPREWDVLGLILEGIPNKKMGELLVERKRARRAMTDETASDHKQRLLKKLECNTIIDLFKFAIRHNLTDAWATPAMIQLTSIST